MQIFVVLTCIVACLLGVSTEPMTKERLNEVKNQCIEETKIEPTVIDKIEKGLEVSKDEEKCFGGCILKKLDIFTEDGTFQKDVAIENIPEEMSHDDAIKLIEYCSTKNGDDMCSTASLIIKCVRDKDNMKESSK